MDGFDEEAGLAADCIACAAAISACEKSSQWQLLVWKLKGSTFEFLDFVLSITVIVTFYYYNYQYCCCCYYYYCYDTATATAAVPATATATATCTTLIPATVTTTIAAATTVIRVEFFCAQ